MQTPNKTIENIKLFIDKANSIEVTDPTSRKLLNATKNCIVADLGKLKKQLPIHKYLKQFRYFVPLASGSLQTFLIELQKSEVQKAIKAYNSRLKLRFALLRAFVLLAINGKIKALSVFGSTGIGKTYFINKLVEKHTNIEPTKITGFCTPTGLLSKLSENPNGLFILDDLSLKHNTTKHILKAACSNEAMRPVSFQNAKHSYNIELTGSVIYIDSEPNDENILNRSISIDLTPKQSKVSNFLYIAKLCAKLAYYKLFA